MNIDPQLPCNHPQKSAIISRQLPQWSRLVPVTASFQLGTIHLLVLSSSAVLNSFAACTVNPPNFSLFSEVLQAKIFCICRIVVSSFSFSLLTRAPGNPEEDKYIPKPIHNESFSLLICLSWASPSNKLNQNTWCFSFNPKIFLLSSGEDRIHQDSHTPNSFTKNSSIWPLQH